MQTIISFITEKLKLRKNIEIDSKDLLEEIISIWDKNKSSIYKTGHEPSGVLRDVDDIMDEIIVTFKESNLPPFDTEDVIRILSKNSVYKLLMENYFNVEWRKSIKTNFEEFDYKGLMDIIDEHDKLITSYILAKLRDENK